MQIYFGFVHLLHHFVLAVKNVFANRAFGLPCWGTIMHCIFSLRMDQDIAKDDLNFLGQLRKNLIKGRVTDVQRRLYPIWHFSNAEPSTKLTSVSPEGFCFFSQVSKLLVYLYPCTLNITSSVLKHQSWLQIIKFVQKCWASRRLLVQLQSNKQITIDVLSGRTTRLNQKCRASCCADPVWQGSSRK